MLSLDVALGEYDFDRVLVEAELVGWEALKCSEISTCVRLRL